MAPCARSVRTNGEDEEYVKLTHRPTMCTAHHASTATPLPTDGTYL
jgi:hypothetical protein